MKKSLLFFAASCILLVMSSAKVMAATATLSGLTTTFGTWNTPFASNTFNYTIKESDVTTSITIKPTAASGTIRINGNTVASGSNNVINLTQGSNVITITVTKGGSATGTYTLTINSEEISYAGTPFIFYSGSTIATASLTEAADIAGAYAISPALPAGLSLNASTGDITGTPTAASAATNYTVTATYSVGITATTIISIRVIAPTINYAGSPFAYYRGTAIATASVTTTGGTPTSYTGVLPPGLVLNASTGDITGTPTTVSVAANYTITARYAGAVIATATVNMQVLAPTIGYAGSPFTFPTGVAISPLTPVVTGTPVSYSISPGLSAGLSFNTSTGVISGTPTATAAAISYTVTANYAGGVTANVSVPITVKLGPPILSYTPATNVYSVGTAIASLTPVNTGGGTAAYSIGPALPAGLLFDNTTGIISGTPTAISPTTTYSISASNSGGIGFTSVTLTVNPAPPVISYTPSTVIYTVSTAITPLTPVSTGGPVVNYSIGPALPAGLALDPVTGIISGTPTAQSTATVYTITATNAGGTGTATVNITVYPLAPVISYTPPVNVYTVGTAITPLTPVNTGGATTNYLIGPALPAGLSFNTITGVISGTPTTTSPVTTYTISADNAGGLSTTTITLSCITPIPPVISYTPSTNVYAAGTAIAPLTPNNTGGAASSYSINTPLPDGLLFNTTTGVISGTPTTATPAAPYVITATNSAGNSSTTVNITINPAAPFITYNPLSNTYTKGTPIVPLVPLNSGGAVSSYSISGALPAGLTFNTATGVISGTPTVSAFTGTVTITGTNASGSSPVVVSITVNSLGPTITYNPAINIFPVGAPITPLTPTSTGGVPSSYAIITGTLPAGLVFNTTTGVISGTPTLETASPVNLTIKATNATGSNNASVQITVSPHAPVISYSPSTNVYAVNVPIATLTPINTGGAVTGFSYSSTGTSLTGATLRGPSLMTTDAAGNIYVCNYNNGTISKYNSSGAYLGLYQASFNFNNPCGIVFDSAGNGYVMDTGNGAIYKFGPTGTYIGAIVTGLGHPLGIAIDGSNNIYIASYNASNVSSVTKYDPSGNLLLTLPNANMNQADGVGVDAAGNIYVLNRATNFATPNSLGNVTKYSASGAYLGVFSSGFNDPLAISLDQGGNVFVADSHNNQIHVYNSAGGLLNTLSGFTDVEGFVADAQGNLYVSDFTNNTVKRYNAMGGYHISAPLPPGLSFNNATGQITGAPTGLFPPTTYTITAYNITGSGSTTVTLSCVNSFDWAGTTSTDWNTASNWLSGVVPGSTDQAVIGVNKAFNYFPNILASAGTVNVGSIAFGNLGGKASGVVVNAGSTLNVSGAITYQSDANSGLGYTCTLSGAGTLNANSISILATTALASSHAQPVVSSVASLNVTGNVSLTSSNSGSQLFNASFTLIAGAARVSGILQTTNTANSTSSFLVSPTTTATLKLDNATALSGLSATGTNTVVFNNAGTTIEYSGAAQTVYTDGAITGLPAGVSYRSITFSGTGVKTGSSGNLNILGDFTNVMTNDASNYVNLSSPAVNFNGTAENLAGGAGLGTTFYNVAFGGLGTKTMVSGQFSVASSGVLTMNGTSSSTVLATGGLLTLNSDLSGSATVAAINGPVISGNVNVQRYITGGRRGYRMLSSAVYAGTAGSNNVTSINYLQLSSYITGAAGGGFDKVGNPTIFLFREDQTPSSTTFISGNWWGISAMNNSPLYNYNVAGQTASGSFYLPVGNGFLFFYRGDRSKGTLAQQTTPSYTNPDPVTLTATGTLNQGQIIVHAWQTPGSAYLPYTGSGTGTNATMRGLTFAGNPYASSIDWEQYNTASSTTGIYAQNVGPTVWEFNPQTYNYDVYQKGGASTNHGRRVIVSGQGFFVLAGSSAQPQLILNESAKIVAQNTGLNLFMSTKGNMASLNDMIINQHLRLQLALDTINTDDIYIGFDSSFKPQYDFSEDAISQPGSGKVSLASYSSDNVLVAINKMPLPGQKRTIIPLKVTATTAGTFKLNLTEQEGIPQLYDIWLKDNFKKDSVNIRKDTSYTFEMSADTNTYGSKRFALVIGQDTALAMHLLTFTAIRATGGSQVNWTTNNEENYTRFTVQRSTDGGNTFDVLGGVGSTGAGSYSFLDKNPKASSNKYRLKLVDLNGTVTYSNIVTLMYANTGGLTKNNDVIIYPNPASKVINLTLIPKTISATPLYKIRITNSSGSIIKTATTNQTEWQTDVSNLSPGAYILQVTSSDNSFVGRGTFVKF
jgi:sugar lactone lactonase YvrE